MMEALMILTLILFSTAVAAQLTNDEHCNVSTESSNVPKNDSARRPGDSLADLLFGTTVQTNTTTDPDDPDPDDIASDFNPADLLVPGRPPPEDALEGVGNPVGSNQTEGSDEAAEIVDEVLE